MAALERPNESVQIQRVYVCTLFGWRTLEILPIIANKRSKQLERRYNNKVIHLVAMHWFALVLTTAMALDFNRNAVISVECRLEYKVFERKRVSEWGDSEEAARRQVNRASPLQNWNHSNTLVHVLNWEIDYVNFVR